VGQQKTVDPIWPTARGLALAASPPLPYLGQGTDLPFSAPLRGAPLRGMNAQIVRSIAVLSFLIAD
jgi:hypothetical protein